jgi:hypothetical protein
LYQRRPLLLSDAVRNILQDQEWPLKANAKGDKKIITEMLHIKPIVKLKHKPDKILRNIVELDEKI